MPQFVTNRVFKVLVAGTAPAGVATGVSSLANGELAVVKRDGTLANASTINEYHSNGDEVQIVIGTATPYLVQKTDFFSPKDITKYSKQGYAPEVQKVITVDLTNIAPIVANFEYILVLNETSDHEILPWRQARTQFDIVATAADTNDTIGAALAYQINSNLYAPVTATYTGHILTLTGKDTSNSRWATGEIKGQINFEVNAYIVQGGISNTGSSYYTSQLGVITNTVPIGPGEGTYRQMYLLERGAQGYKGVTNWRKFPIDAGEYFIQLGLTYDIRIIELEKTHSTNSATLQRVRSPQTFIVAFPVGSPETAAFDAMFAQIGIGSSTIDDA